MKHKSKSFTSSRRTTTTTTQLPRGRSQKDLLPAKQPEPKPVYVGVWYILIPVEPISTLNRLKTAALEPDLHYESLLGS